MAVSDSDKLHDTSMIHYFWSIALCSAIHKMNIRHFRICVKIDHFSDNTKLDGSQFKVEYNNPCVIKWSHTDVNELTKRHGNYCQQIWNKPGIFDLQWWNMPNCVLTWAEGTLNIYCRFNLFSTELINFSTHLIYFSQKKMFNSEIKGFRSTVH